MNTSENDEMKEYEDTKVIFVDHINDNMIFQIEPSISDFESNSDQDQLIIAEELQITKKTKKQNIIHKKTPNNDQDNKENNIIYESDEMDQIEEIGEIEEFEDIHEMNQMNKIEEINFETKLKSIMNEKKRMTFPYLTKFEKVLLLGYRVQQIKYGSKIMIDLKKYNLSTPLSIAEEELKQKIIPFKIKRPLPNGSFEIWDLKELIDLDNY